jgi:dipeptidyl aminopeptidase/acylaminoacyl peptidase
VVRRPVLLIHGVRDDVAPIWDATDLAGGLRERGLLIGMLMLEDAGHQVSGSSLAAVLDAELGAYQRVLKDAG